MITSMHIENFKCFKEFDIELGPFNVLIGPNDSGKTALLQAVQLLGYAVSAYQPSAYQPNAADILDRHLDRGGPARAVEWSLELKAGLTAVLGATDNKQLIWRSCPENDLKIHGVDVIPGGSPLEVTISGPSKGESLTTEFLATEGWAELPTKETLVRYSLGSFKFYQFDPKALRQPTKLSTGMASDGTGLPGFIARMALERDGTMDSLEDDFKRRFPFYKAIVTKPVPEAKGDIMRLGFRPVQGEDIPCQSVSDGVMLSLAFMAVCHAKQSPDILLIEEPENGVHHASLKDIVETLKQLSKEKGVQVIMTTHSPYLLDHVDPEEVFVFSKDKEGAVHAKKLSDHPDVQDLRKHFMTGEMWTGLEDEGDFLSKLGEHK